MDLGDAGGIARLTKEINMMGWNYGGWSWMTGLGMVLMVILWVALIALVVWGVGALTRGHSSGAPTMESPRQILDRRFASGEMDATQYAETRRALEGRSVDPRP
jgi:putative membrane protein